MPGLLADARRELRRITPTETAAADDVLIVDIRGESERLAEGRIPGSVVIDRNVLEWRLDPYGEHRRVDLDLYPERLVVVVCNEGYASSFAARSLQLLGLRRATDMIGGHRAWVAMGLPVEQVVPAPR